MQGAVAELARAGERPRSCSASRRSRCSASSTRSQHFGPTDGAYASVFCAWTAFYAIAVLATMYWLETQVATELRARRVPAHMLDEETGGDIKDPDRLIAPRPRRVRLLLVLPGRRSAWSPTSSCTCSDARRDCSRARLLGLVAGPAARARARHGRCCTALGDRRTRHAGARAAPRAGVSARASTAASPCSLIALASPLDALSASSSSGCT